MELNINMGRQQMSNVETSVKEKSKVIIEEPGFYKVILLNDDVTPMEFVIDLLQRVFRHDLSTSTDITMTIHNEGSGIAGVYSFEIAEQKSIEATIQSRNFGFPLQIKIEKE